MCTGLLDAAKEVLRVTFEQHPCGATFAMFQRFIRRNLGIVAARRVFSETHSMRQKDPTLALEVRIYALYISFYVLLCCSHNLILFVIPFHIAVSFKCKAGIRSQLLCASGIERS